MAGRKLARDFLFSNAKQPFFRPIRFSQPEANGSRFCMISVNGYLPNRHYSILSDFSKTIERETASNKEFQQSVKQLKEKTEQFKGVKEELKARMQQTTEQLYKQVDGMYEEVVASARKVMGSFEFGKQDSSTSTSSQFSSTTNDAYTNHGNKAENTGEPQSGFNDAAGGISSMFRSMFSSVSPKISLAFQKLIDAKAYDTLRKGYEVVKDDLTGKSHRRRRLDCAASTPFTGEISERTEVVIAPSTQSAWGKKWDSFKQKIQGHPFLKRVEKMSEPVVTKTQEYAENIQEMWETSDNPVVHKIQDLNDRVFGENDAAICLKEIRSRDPSFSLSEFVAEVEEVTKPILNALIKGDFEVLMKYCTPDLIQRYKAIHSAYEKQGLVFDKKMLHVSEVYVSTIKMMGDTPIILLNFQTQQVHCLRDKLGLVKDGSKDTIQTVYYLWALRQMEQEAIGKDGIYYTWKLMDMQEHGVTALI